MVCNQSPTFQRISVSPRLPANRAQGSAGPLTPFRPTHRGGRSTHGPTTVRAASRLSKRPCRLRRASRPRERISIARVARGQAPRQVVSELGTTAGKRLEAGAGRVEAPSTDRAAQEDEWRARQGARRWRFRDRGRDRPPIRYDTSPNRNYEDYDLQSSILRYLGGHTVRQSRTVRRHFCGQFWRCYCPPVADSEEPSLRTFLEVLLSASRGQ